MATKHRPLRLSSDRSLYSPRGLDHLALLRRLSPANLMALLAGVTALILLAYLLTGSAFILVLAVIAAGIGADGLIRLHPSSTQYGVFDTAVYLFLPVLFTLGAGVFFRYTLHGVWEIPAAAVSGALLGSILFAEYHSVDAGGERYLTMRLILNLTGYLAAFSLYTALYNRNLPLLVAAILVGAVSFAIGIEILREIDLKTDALVLFGASLGFVMAQARWALNFISLTGWLGGVFILIVFYVASQVLQSYLWGRFDRRVALEFGGVAAIGTLLVIAGRVLSHG